MSSSAAWSCITGNSAEPSCVKHDFAKPELQSVPELLKHLGIDQPPFRFSVLRKLRTSLSTLQHCREVVCYEFLAGVVGIKKFESISWYFTEQGLRKGVFSFFFSSFFFELKATGLGSVSKCMLSSINRLS